MYQHGRYTFEECVINLLPAVKVTADSGCTLGTWYLPTRCDLEGFAQKFLDPFTRLTTAEVII